MKKLIASTIFAAISASFIFASGVENKTNLSTGYLRNPSRNTENERPEAAFYNIAGTAFLKEGLWVGGGNQFVFKEYSNKLDTNDYYATGDYSSLGIKDYKSTDDTTVWLYPDLNAVYKKGRWSIFSNFGVYAGGGSLSYDEGTSATTLLFLDGAKNLQKEAAEAGLAASAAQTLLAQGDDAVYKATQLTSKQLTEYAGKWATESTEKAQAAAASLAMAKDHSLDVTSITYGIQLGAAYLVTDWLSLSAAYRYTIGTQDMTLKCNKNGVVYAEKDSSGNVIASTAKTFSQLNGGSNKISYDAVGYGQSMVFGIHAKPPVVPNLDLSLQYQTLSRIEYNVDNVKGNIAQYYDITNDKNFRTDLPAVLNLGAGYHVLDNLYVSTSFNYYFNDFAHQDSILSETDYDNSWEVALGVDYRFCKYVGASIGASYGNQGTTDTSNSTFNPVLDNIVVGGGFEIYPTDQLTVSLSCLYANYFDTDYYLGSKTSSTKTVLSKDVINAGIGVTYHFN
ncbi:hypothetical protein [uncultured Treponema sp.]|uniref:OmpP1/FadL family transporter n=1 Tax=uncultured Treponema sp. TaxID=162155 RepID=UPI0025D85FDB|nr:hypothetical protein [uncultured Treponema sp.]